MKRPRKPGFYLFALFALGTATMIALPALAPVAAAAENDKKKIVFVAGAPSHGRGNHEHRAGNMLLADHLNKSGLPVEAEVTYYGWPEDESIFDGADAVIIFSNGAGNHPALPHLDTLRELISNGVGIGAIHFAVEVPKGEPGEVFLDAIGGYFETHWSVNPTWTAEISIGEHEVGRGINDYEMHDEWYYHMRFREDMEGITPILSALPPESSLERDDGPHSGNPHVREAVLERKEIQHMMWVFDRPEEIGGGRGFGFNGAHFHKNWQHDDQRRVVLNAIAWIAGLEVPEDGVPSETPTDEEMEANLDD